MQKLLLEVEHCITHKIQAVSEKPTNQLETLACPIVGLEKSVSNLKKQYSP